MKRYLFLLILIISSFAFSACQSPDSGEEVNVVELRDNLGEGNFAENEGLVPQLGVPSDEDDFKQPLTEQAKKNGLTDEDVSAVRQKLAESFSLDISEVQITTEGESSLEFMTGYVNVGEGEKGGIYFAARTSDGWIIAHNGVGIVYCDLVDQYDFPVGMVPKCYDIDTGISVERE
jgi:hypothetical protein